MRRQFAVLCLLLVALPVSAANRFEVLPSGDRIDVFDEPGGWTWTPDWAVVNARVLVVGGGGSGGSNTGGGGAGGQVVYLQNQSFQAGTAYTVTIGAGGASKTGWNYGENGGNTVFSTITAKGGGAGSTSGGGNKGTAGANSGGSNGGGVQTSVSGTNDPANGWYGAHTGGTGCNFGCGGGGGGALGNGGNGSYVGSDSQDGDGGVGGDGFPCDITGTTVRYACGGGGGSKGRTPGAGGGGEDTTAGAGGYKDNTPAGSGVAGTGSGGGGGGCTSSGKGISGAGGSGVVIIRYASPTPYAEVSDYEGLIDGKGHNVTIVPVFTPAGTSIAYSVDDGEHWLSDFALTNRGVRTVTVKMSAPGYQDFLTTATVTLKDAEDDNDGTRFFVVPPDTPGHVAAAPYASWSTAATNIQDAVDAVTMSGAQIFIRSGRYPLAASLTLNKSDLMVRSWKKDVGALDAANTVIDAGYPDRTIRAVMVQTASLHGLTIANGYVSGNSGGGVYFASGRGAATAYDFEECIFTNNCATSRGGAVYVAAAARFRSCTFAGNGVSGASVNGGAVCCGQASVFDGCVFRDNSATGSWACGGVIRCDNVDLTCRNCTFEDNALNDGVSTDGVGAVINRSSAGGLMVISNCCFRNNTRVGSKVRGLITGSPAGNGWSRLYDCTFTNNSWGCGLDGKLELDLERCAFDGSTGYLNYDGRIVARNCLFVDAGTICRVGTGDYPCRYENSTFVRTKFVRTCSNMSGAIAVNCAFSGNTADYSVESGDGSPMYVTNCVTTVSGLESKGPGNRVVADLRFTDPARGDYSIRRSSPCRDAAVLLPWMDSEAKDLAGNPRVVRNGVPLARDPQALPDVGCHENTAGPRGLLVFLK